MTASEEQVFGNTVLLLRIVAEKRPPDVEESDRQAQEIQVRRVGMQKQFVGPVSNGPNVEGSEWETM